MAMLSKAKMMQEEAKETLADEAKETPAQQKREAEMGVEQHDTSAPPDGTAPDSEEASESPEGAGEDDESAEGEEGGLSDAQMQEYQKAVQALHVVLYKNEQTGRAVLSQLSPQDKVGSLARCAVLIMQQLDKKLNFSDAIIPLMIITVVDRLLELADRVKKIKFSDQESAAVVNAVSQGVKALYGSAAGNGPEPQTPPQPGAAPPDASQGGAAPQPGAAPSQSLGGPTPPGPGLPTAPQAGPAPNPGGEELNG